MTQALKLVLPLLLATCPAAAQTAETATDSGPITRQTASRDSSLLDFEYSWPQPISSETQLVDRLKGDLSITYEQALNEARENKAQTEKVNAPFHQNQFTRIWNLEGQTPRLTSLVAGTDTFTGGAHPNHTSSALLWDRNGQREMKLGELFASADGFESAVRPRFCKLLDAERLKRREGETLDGEFSQCPAFSELTIAPADTNSSGRFDSIQLTADPYIAGPYVEGSYEIIVPVSAALVGQVKPEFRTDFEAQPPQ